MKENRTVFYTLKRRAAFLCGVLMTALFSLQIYAATATSQEEHVEEVRRAYDGTIASASVIVNSNIILLVMLCIITGFIVALVVYKSRKGDWDTLG